MVARRAAARVPQPTWSACASSERCARSSREGGVAVPVPAHRAPALAALGGRQAAVEPGAAERDLLAEVVDVAASGQARSPWCRSRCSGARARARARRLLNLSYGAPTRPDDVAKVSVVPHHLPRPHVKVGDAIDVTRFAQDARQRGRERDRAQGAALDPALPLPRGARGRGAGAPAAPPRAGDRAARSPRSRPRSSAAPSSGTRPPEAGARRGRAHVPRDRREHELDLPRDPDLVVERGCSGACSRRSRTQGLEKVTEYAKRDPVVLVPSHRSYFDFLILSWLFYAHHLVPPHIAARENMGFGPFGFLFRRAGAFFLRTLVRRPALQGGVPRLRLLPDQGGLHAGVLHRGRALAHRQDAGAAARHAGLEHRSVPRQRAPRSLLRAGRDHLRAAGRGGRDGRASSRAARRRPRACSAWCARGSSCSAASAACS